jgi:hypothetical protein
MGGIQRTFSGLCGFALAAMLIAPRAYGQVAPAAQPETVVDILHQLSDKADVIFAGQVVAIRRPNDGAVEVEFRVDEAIRGCTTGTPYILREWAGLWMAGNQRYHVGQRLLMLLHAPSSAGMSSPVGGLDGAIPIRQGGTTMSTVDVGAPRQPPFVDLRWLGARLPRAVAYRSESVPAAKTVGVAAPSIPRTQAVGGVAASSIVSGGAPVVDDGGQSGGSVPAQQASVNAVIGMLTSWEKARHVAP